MNICIDVRTLWKRKSGVENYVYSIVDNLLKINNNNKYFLLKEKNGSGLGFEDLIGQNDRIRFLPTVFSNENHPIGDLWENIYLPGILKNLGVNIFHGPNYLIPFRKKGFSTIATIHDLVAFLFPETVPKKYSLYMKFIIRNVVKYSNKIIVDANSTKADLIRLFKVSEDKISVIYGGVSRKFYPGDELSVKEIKLRLNLPDNFILHVGNLEPRKNFKGIIDAFYSILQQKKFKGLKLVLTGQKGWLYKGILKNIEKKGIMDSITFTGYVDSEDLPALYSAARLFIFPSYYEGFGLPVLEAMACGTPVITSNVSSLPEVAGDSAILVDPTNTDEIADSIERLLEDEDLRQIFIKKGLERAKHFFWEKTAKELLNVYEEVYNLR